MKRNDFYEDEVVGEVNPTYMTNDKVCADARIFVTQTCNNGLDKLDLGTDIKISRSIIGT